MVRRRMGVRVGMGMGVLQREGVQRILGVHGTGPVERGIVTHVMRWGLRGRVVKSIAAVPRDCRRRLLQCGEREGVLLLLLHSLRMRSGVPRVFTRRCRRHRRWVRQRMMSIGVAVQHGRRRWRGYGCRHRRRMVEVSNVDRDCRRRRRDDGGAASCGQLLGCVPCRSAVDGQCDGVVHAEEQESIGGDGFVHGEVDAFVVVVVQGAKTLKGGGTRLPEGVDVEVELELLWIRGTEPDSAGQVHLDSRAERDHPDLLDDDGLRELNEIEVEFRLQIMAERIEEEQLLTRRNGVVHVGGSRMR